MSLEDQILFGYLINATLIAALVFASCTSYYGNRLTDEWIPAAQDWLGYWFDIALCRLGLDYWEGDTSDE